jgi:transcriptional regulator with XRE-family HTH domain
MSKFSDRLTELREKQGYTQEDLAKLLKVSRSTVSMYEQGKREPNFKMQETIADFFNVNIDYLVGRGNDDNEKILIEIYRNSDDTQKEHLLYYAQMLANQQKLNRTKDFIENVEKLDSLRKNHKQTD